MIQSGQTHKKRMVAYMTPISKHQYHADDFSPSLECVIINAIYVQLGSWVEGIDRPRMKNVKVDALLGISYLMRTNHLTLC